MNANRAVSPCISITDLNESDFKLMKAVLMTRGDLFSTTLACKLVAKHCRFPIQKPTEIVNSILQGPGSFGDLAGHAVSFDDIMTFMTPDLFPIENLDDLAHKVMLAFDRQNTVAQAREVISSIEHLQQLKKP